MKGEPIKIGPYTIQVYTQDLDTGDAGYYSAGYHKLIRLDANQAGPELLDTYVHECIEAINHIHDLHMPHENIQTLGICLAQAFASNPKLLSRLLKQACSER
jgi:hypothetical protein